jgi:putative transposase
MSPAECGQVLKVINSEAYAALSIGQVWICELDEDRYWCSLSSMYRMYRIARRAGQTRAIRPGPHGTYAGSHERQKRRLPRATT